MLLRLVTPAFNCSATTCSIPQFKETRKRKSFSPEPHLIEVDLNIGDANNVSRWGSFCFQHPQGGCNFLAVAKSLFASVRHFHGPLGFHSPPESGGTEWETLDRIDERVNEAVTKPWATYNGSDSLN